VQVDFCFAFFAGFKQASPGYLGDPYGCPQNYENSGVCVRAVIDDSHDDDDDTETDTYYGQIEEIWEHDYIGLEVALFRCRWVTNGKRAVSKEKYGYVSVDLRVFGYKNELFVFSNDVGQVFYVPDLAKKNWSVVMPEKKGGD
jgi:hypothetical protein